MLTVAKTDVPALLEAIAAQRRLIAPIEDRMGTSFGEVSDPAAVRLDYRNTHLSSKEVVFPQCETLLRFRDDEAEDALSEERETVLFGVRPCDARALSLLDRVFTWDGLDDPYYLRRRQGTIVVALACREPGPACFCTSVGGAPAGEAGADVLATDLGDRLLLQAVKERGDALLEDAGVGEAASDADVEAAKQAAESAEALLASVKAPTDLERLRATFDSDVWSELAMGCLGCGACTYSCPTCHCFDITDETRKGVGKRVRSWDTCAFPLFTLHGSGHNPRPAKDARLRQRILHKFLYCPENFGEVFCVGCGRCISNCPTGIDLRRILERLEQLVSAA